MTMPSVLLDCSDVKGGFIMEQTNFRYTISQVDMKHGVPFEPGRINVFVGANNCGKTQLLKDMLSYITGKRETPVIINELKIPYPETWEQIEQSYEMHPIETTQGLQLRHICPTLDKDASGYTNHDLQKNLEYWLKNDHRQFRHVTGDGLVTYLNTDNRLKLAIGQTAQRDLQKRGAKNVLEALYVAGTDATRKVRECIQRIFETDIYLDISNLGMIQYRVGKDFSSIPADPQAAFEKLTDYEILDNQGDGLRSVVGMLTAIVALKKPIILLDEPEAFLHPPQALQLGEIISDLIDDSQQIFIATHSADFLKGLLGSTKDAMIIHLDRSKETVTEAKALSSKELEQIITEPLLSSSRVLEGMFYKGVVATEADADTAFYQRLFQKVGASDEIHFLNTPGKQALKKVIAPYQKLGIKFAIIADADVIREDSDMKALLHLTSDEGKKDRIQQERAEVLGYFQSQSKYDKLVALHDELQALALQKLPSTETNAEDIDAVLSEYRAKLKKLRDETDDLSALKEFGRDALPPEHQGHFDCLCRLCSSIGLFVVWVGELESWLVDYGVARTTNKPKWIAEALTKVYDIKYDSTKNIWKFVDSLRAFLIN